MKNRISGYGLVTGAVLCALSLVFVSTQAAQQKSNVPTSVTIKSPANQPRTADKDPLSMPTPRMANGHPNLTGFWAGGAPPDSDDGTNPTNPNQTVHEITRTSDGSVFYSYAGANGGTEAAVDGYAVHPQTTAPYKPEYLAKVKQIVSVQYGRTNINDPDDRCVPAGVPRAGFGGFVVSSPEAIAIMYEATPGPYYRIIYTDGRPHPTDYDTSYMGHSIGHWDGDTLVIDTIGLDDTTWLQGPGNSIHSDKEHVVERWTRKGDQVTVETTVEDPVMFTKPWVLPARKINLTTGDPSQYGNYILPAMCNTNDKDHWVVNDKYVCNWCNSGSVYGEKTDKLTVPDDVRQKAGQFGGGAPGAARPAGGGGGE